MIVECPRCGVRYPLDDSMVGSRGASVRCGNCHLVWRQKAQPLSDNFLVPVQVEPYKEKSSKLKWIFGFIFIASVGGVIFKTNPKVREVLEALFNLRHPKTFFEIRKFCFERIKDTSNISCRGEIHNPSHQTLENPSLLFYFVNPLNREHYEKVCYPFEGLSLLPGQSYAFSVTLTAREESLSLVSVGLP